MSDDAPSQPRPRGAPARAGARGPLLIAVNRRAGADDKDATLDAVETVLRDASRRYEIHEPRARESIEALMRRVARAAAQQNGVLVVAGGDGTVNAAVNAAHAHGVPLGLLPSGTFNYLAREHGIPLEPADAARVLVEGVPRPVPMGELNGRLFFNNASIGLYAGVVRQRERAKRRFGRRRIVAALANAAAFLQGQAPFAIQTIADDDAALRYTSMVFVACNRYQLELLGLEAAACKDAGALAVLVLRPTNLGQRLRLLVRTALRQLDADGRLDTFCARDLEVRSQRREVTAAIDGEMVSMHPPLKFRALPEAVSLLVPAGP